MATVQVKIKEKSDIDRVLSHIKQLQTSMTQLQTSIDRLAQQNIDMKSIKPKIVDALDVDFVKQVCYENNFDCNVIKLIVIYKHDDYDFVIDTIFERFGKLEDQFPDLDLQMLFFDVSKIKPSRLDNTTTVFKKEE